MSLKPPWRQKNPVMEKACPAYYKNTAPAEAVKILENVTVRDTYKNVTLTEKEIVKNTTWGNKRVTIALLYRTGEKGKAPYAVLKISPNSVLIQRLIAHSFKVFYKGEKVFNIRGGVRKAKVKGLKFYAKE